MDIERINYVLGKAIVSLHDDEIMGLSEEFRLPQYYKDNMKKIRAMKASEFHNNWYRQIFNSLTDKQKEQIASGSRVGRQILHKLGFRPEYYGGSAMQDILIKKIAKDIAKPKINIPTPKQMHQKYGMPLGPVTFENVIKDVGDVFGVLKTTNRVPDKGQVKGLLKVVPSQTSIMDPKSRKNVLIALRYWLGVLRSHIKGLARSKAGDARIVRDSLKDAIKKIAEQRGGGDKAPRRAKRQSMSKGSGTQLSFR